MGSPLNFVISYMFWSRDLFLTSKANDLGIFFEKRSSFSWIFKNPLKTYFAEILKIYEIIFC